MTDIGLTLMKALERWSEPKIWQEYKRLSPAEKDGPLVISSVYVQGPTAHSHIPDSRLQVYMNQLKSELITAFIEYLRSNKLTATGIEFPRTIKSKRQKIDPDFWNYLRPNFSDSSASGEGLRLIGIRVTEAEPVTLSTEVILQSKKPGISSDSGYVSRRELQNWYTGVHLREMRAKGVRSSRDDDRRVAKAKFGKRVKSSMVDQVRRDCAPPEWLERGRRKGESKKPRD